MKYFMSFLVLALSLLVSTVSLAEQLQYAPWFDVPLQVHTNPSLFSKVVTVTYFGTRKEAYFHFSCSDTVDATGPEEHGWYPVNVKNCSTGTSYYGFLFAAYTDRPQDIEYKPYARGPREMTVLYDRTLARITPDFVDGQVLVRYNDNHGQYTLRVGDKVTVTGEQGVFLRVIAVNGVPIPKLRDVKYDFLPEMYWYDPPEAVFLYYEMAN